MLFRGVWYPTGLCSAGSDTPQDFVKRVIRPRRTLFCGVSDPAEQVYAIKCMYTTLPRLSSAGSDTPQDLVLRGLIPRRILFCGVSVRLRWQIKTPQNQTKKFWELAFSLKEHFSKIVYIYKLHYRRHIGSMLKEPPIWSIFLCSAGSDSPQNNFEIRYLREFARIWKCFMVWIRGPYGVDSWEKPWAKNQIFT